MAEQGQSVVNSVGGGGGGEALMSGAGGGGGGSSSNTEALQQSTTTTTAAAQQPAAPIMTQVHSETTTYATDGNRFVERHEVLAGPVGEEEGYVEKREGRVGVVSGGVVEEVEEGREVEVLEGGGGGGGQGRIVGEEVVGNGETEMEGGKVGVEVEAEGEVDEVDVDDVGGSGTKEPPHTEAATPEQPAEKPEGTKAESQATTKDVGGDVDTAGEAGGADKDKDDNDNDNDNDVSLIDADRKRKADGEHEDVAGGEDAKKLKAGSGGGGGGGEVKRGRGRPAKGEANGKGKHGGGGGGGGKEPVEGTRRSTRSKGKV